MVQCVYRHDKEILHWNADGVMQGRQEEDDILTAILNRKKKGQRGNVCIGSTLSVRDVVGIITVAPLEHNVC